MNAPYIASNMTAREVLRQHGYLPESVAETVIDAAEFAEKADDISCEVLEGTGGPGEDCLQSHIDYLRDFVKRLRGDNRADLLLEIERLEQTQLEFWQSTEYRTEKLNSALRMLAESPV